jgi:hypothetical protein
VRRTTQTGHLEPYQNSIKGTIENNIKRAREYVSVDNLKRSWLLSLVPENVLAVLASVFRLRVVSKGGLILSSEEGAADRPADTCVILVSGSALVSTRLVDGQVRAYPAPHKSTRKHRPNGAVSGTSQQLLR